jgi:hypothetical protein
MQNRTRPVLTVSLGLPLLERIEALRCSTGEPMSRLVERLLALGLARGNREKEKAPPACKPSRGQKARKR